MKNTTINQMYQTAEGAIEAMIECMSIGHLIYEEAARAPSLARNEWLSGSTRDCLVGCECL